jgi:anti-anti-sigma regulatory factor
MVAWRRVSLVDPQGMLRAPGRVADEVGAGDASAGVILTGHPFGRVLSHARLLCHHLARVGHPWATEADLRIGGQRGLLRLARRSGCRALVVGPDPDPLGRDLGGADERNDLRAGAADLRRIRRAGLLAVVRCTIGRVGDDAGVFGRAVRLCIAGRVAFPRLIAAEDEQEMGKDELARGLAWAERRLYTPRAIWRRTGALGRHRLAALVANLRARRDLRPRPESALTPAMRLAHALARPIRIRERVPFVSTLVGAMQVRGVRSAWLRARAVRDETVAALVIRLEGAVDARAARMLVMRVRRALGRRPERIIVDLGGVEVVSLTVLTRFLEEHASRLAELRGRLAFRNLRPALAALRQNLHGTVPNAALLEHALEEAI